MPHVQHIVPKDQANMQGKGRGEVIPNPIPGMTRGVYLMDMPRGNKLMVGEGVLHLFGALVRPLIESKDMVPNMDLSLAILNHHITWEERRRMIMSTHRIVSFLYGTGRVLM